MLIYYAIVILFFKIITIATMIVLKFLYNFTNNFHEARKNISFYLFTGPNIDSIKLSSIAYVGGYVIKKLLPDVECNLCRDVIATSSCSSVLMDLIYKRDVSGNSLYYPTTSFVNVLAVTSEFVENAVRYLPSCGVRKQLQSYLIPELNKFFTAACEHCESQDHSTILAGGVCKYFLPIVLKRVAFIQTEAFERPKYLNAKPLGRKVLRL